jgi:hypothetical protein
LEALCK